MSFKSYNLKYFFLDQKGEWGNCCSYLSRKRSPKQCSCPWWGRQQDRAGTVWCYRTNHNECPWHMYRSANAVHTAPWRNWGDLLPHPNTSPLRQSKQLNSYNKHIIAVLHDFSMLATNNPLNFDCSPGTTHSMPLQAAQTGKLRPSWSWRWLVCSIDVPD